MSNHAIQVENLSKAYRIGLKEEIPDTFMGAATGWLKAPLRNLRRLRRLNTFAENAGQNGDAKDQLPEKNGNSCEPASDTIWALRDVSFEVQPGEVVGIIGRNGAGKSTLLKILSRITDPTSGRAVINGRVSSLLEVGTGFHPELTGRENIYMNGTILGMTKREIDRKFDEIVDFSGVEKFLDTPTKRYSSGMTVRLAFSVAAHLEPEILIIDEVLAVGDQEFQNKCLGKMNEVAHSGRTVLFVSHNMAAVEGLCMKAIHLSGGQLSHIGETHDVIAGYLQHGLTIASEIDLSDHPRRVRGMQSVLKSVSISLGDGSSVNQIPLGSDIRFDVVVDPPRPIRYARLAIRLFNSVGLRVTTCHNEYQHPEPIAIAGKTTLRCIMRNCRLAPGAYTVNLQFDDHRVALDKIDSCAGLEIIPTDIYGTSRVLPTHAAIVFPEVEWSVRAGGMGERLAASFKAC